MDSDSLPKFSVQRSETPFLNNLLSLDERRYFSSLARIRDGLTVYIGDEDLSTEPPDRREVLSKQRWFYLSEEWILMEEYAIIHQPVRDGDRWMIGFEITEAGSAMLRAVERGEVWNRSQRGVDRAETLKFWIHHLRSAIKTRLIPNRVFDVMGEIEVFYLVSIRRLAVSLHLIDIDKWGFYDKDVDARAQKLIEAALADVEALSA